MAIDGKVKDKYSTQKRSKNTIESIGKNYETFRGVLKGVVLIETAHSAYA